MGFEQAHGRAVEAADVCGAFRWLAAARDEEEVPAIRQKMRKAQRILLTRYVEAGDLSRASACRRRRHVQTETTGVDDLIPSIPGSAQRYLVGIRQFL